MSIGKDGFYPEFSAIMTKLLSTKTENELRVRLAECEEVLKHTEEVLRHTTRSLTLLEFEARQLENELENANEGHEALVDRYCTLKDEYSRYQEESRAMLRNLQSTNDELRFLCAVYSDDAKKDEELIVSLRKAVNSLEKRLFSLAGDYDKLQEKNDALQTDASFWKTEYNLLRNNRWNPRYRAPLFD